MKRVLAIVLLAVLCLGVIASPAMAAPKSSSNGNAYAYGLIKNVGNNGQAKKGGDEHAPSGDWEWVMLYPGATSCYPDGMSLALFKRVQTGYLGYAEPDNTYIGPIYYSGGTPIRVMYNPVFSTRLPGAPWVGWSWADPDNRITYAVAGYTTVTHNGVSYPFDSPQARALFADHSITWNCTYREMYDIWGTKGIGWNGWLVSDYSPATK